MWWQCHKRTWVFSWMGKFNSWLRISHKYVVKKHQLKFKFYKNWNKLGRGLNLWFFFHKSLSSLPSRSSHQTRIVYSSMAWRTHTQDAHRIVYSSMVSTPAPPPPLAGIWFQINWPSLWILVIAYNVHVLSHYFCTKLWNRSDFRWIAPLFLEWLITLKGRIGHKNVFQLATYQRSNKESMNFKYLKRRSLSFCYHLISKIQLTKRRSSLCYHLISKKGPDEIQMSKRKSMSLCFSFN